MPAPRPATEVSPLPAAKIVCPTTGASPLPGVWWGRRFACPRSARPRPKLRRLNQPRINRILVDITSNAVQFLPVPYPMVVGFVLPERLAGSSQHSISRTCRRPFQPTHNLRNREPGQHQQVNVVRHDHPSAKFVELLVPLTSDEGSANGKSDLRVLQPNRTVAGLMQGAVGSYERVPGIRMSPSAELRRQRSPETPRQEEVIILGVIMWQAPVIFGHGRSWAGESPAPPEPSSAARPTFFSRNTGPCH